MSEPNDIDAMAPHRLGPEEDFFRSLTSVPWPDSGWTSVAASAYCDVPRYARDITLDVRDMAAELEDLRNQVQRLTDEMSMILPYVIKKMEHDRKVEEELKSYSYDYGMDML